MCVCVCVSVYLCVCLNLQSLGICYLSTTLLLVNFLSLSLHTSFFFQSEHIIITHIEAQHHLAKPIPFKLKFGECNSNKAKTVNFVQGGDHVEGNCFTLPRQMYDGGIFFQLQYQTNNVLSSLSIPFCLSSSSEAKKSYYTNGLLA